MDNAAPKYSRQGEALISENPKESDEYRTRRMSIVAAKKEHRNMEQRIAKLEAAILGLTDRVGTLESERKI